MLPISPVIADDDPVTDYGLLKIPDLDDPPKSIWKPFQISSSIFHFHLDHDAQAQSHSLDLEPEFLALNSTEESIHDFTSLEESTSESQAADEVFEQDPVRHGTIDDVWSWTDVVAGTRDNKLVNWDNFLHPQTARSQSGYLSEADPICFDAVLAIETSRSKVSEPRLAARQQDVLANLFELGSGRDSSLYCYDQKFAKYVPVTTEFGVLGLSVEAQQSFLQDVLEMGNSVHYVENFIAKQHSQPLAIALASAASTILYVIKNSLQASRTDLVSLLQLRDLFARPICLLDALACLIKLLEPCRRDEEAVLKLAHEAQILSTRHIWQSKILHEILRRVSGPWISSLATEAGLRADLTEARTGVGDEQQTSDSSRNTFLIFIEQTVAESKNCLRIMKEEHVDDEFLNSLSSTSPSLSWEMSWDAIMRIQSKANEYEQRLQRSILEFGLHSKVEPPSLPQEMAQTTSTNQEVSSILIDFDSTSLLDRGLGKTSLTLESDLSRLTSAALKPSIEPADTLLQCDLSPPFAQCLSLSLSPLLSAQSSLLSFSALHLLFKRRSLRNHLELQHRFQLMSDGLFASRLSRSLFDPDQLSGEGRRTSGGITGLRMQARNTWPPASSELRLALMGILSESYYTGATIGEKHSRAEDEDDSTTADLLGNLSFAIRDLSAEQIDKCCEDATSISALDFLHLQYRPPSPVLATIITRSSLRKYDKIFLYMLRLLRMQSVALTLLRSTCSKTTSRGSLKLNLRPCHQRFRIEIQHFVTCMTGYAHQTAIGLEWARFQRVLNEIEAAIDRADYHGTIAKTGGGLSRVERLHAHVLDRISRALFLDRRQAPVRQVVEDAFSIILRFSSSMAGEDGRKGEEREEEEEEDQVRRKDGAKEDDGKIKQMHTEFRRLVGKLVRYLKNQDNLVGREQRHCRPGLDHVGTNDDDDVDDHGIDRHEPPPPPFEDLLLRLDFRNHYS